MVNWRERLQCLVDSVIGDAESLLEKLDFDEEEKELILEFEDKLKEAFMLLRKDENE